MEGKGGEVGISKSQQHFKGLIRLILTNATEPMKKKSPQRGKRKILPGRKSRRLKGYDYRREGLYFITICCHNRIHRFGYVENGKMILNEFGKIAEEEWKKLSERYPRFKLDTFQIMPDHIHGIIRLQETKTGSGFTSDLKRENPKIDSNLADPNHVETSARDISTAGPNYLSTKARDISTAGPNHLSTKARDVSTADPSVPDIVGAYKSLVANGCLKIYKSKNEFMGKFWQRSYHDHIIREEISYYRIAMYIRDNPIKWGVVKKHRRKKRV